MWTANGQVASPPNVIYHRWGKKTKKKRLKVSSESRRNHSSLLFISSIWVRRSAPSHPNKHRGGGSRRETEPLPNGGRFRRVPDVFMIRHNGRLEMAAEAVARNY